MMVINNFVMKHEAQDVCQLHDGCSRGAIPWVSTRWLGGGGGERDM